MRTDTQLIALIREGHDGAFEILFNRYQPRLLAFCRRMVGSPQDAEDVLQEVFAAAHAAILADDRAINVRPWLYRIARNRCLSHIRKPPTADGVDSQDPAHGARPAGDRRSLLCGHRPGDEHHAALGEVFDGSRPDVAL